MKLQMKTLDENFENKKKKKKKKKKRNEKLKRK